MLLVVAVPPIARGACGEPRTIGQAFVGSDAYLMWKARFPGEAPPRGQVMGGQVLIRTSLGDVLKMRALVTTADAVAGSMIPPHHAGLLAPGLVRPRVVRDLLLIIPTQSDAVQYAQEVSRESDAAPVAEASAVTGTTGTKPEGGLVFQLVTEHPDHRFARPGHHEDHLGRASASLVH